MDIKQLESFVAITKHKSFSKAAEKLFITQPTISSHIQSLENELGTLLFNRLNKTITLTAAGEILYEYAVGIVNKKESALYAMSEYRGKIEGILEIASSSIPEQYFLVDLICDFHKKFPHVRYVLMKHDTGEVIEKLISGDIDFGIVGSKKVSPNLEFLEIMDDEVIMVSSTELYTSSLKKISIKDMTSVPMIVREPSSGSRQVVENALLEKKIDPKDLNVIAEVEDNEAIKKFIKNGMGVTFISRRAVEKELEAGLFTEIKIPKLKILRKFYFVYHKKRVLSPLTLAFKDFLTKRDSV